MTNKLKLIPHSKPYISPFSLYFLMRAFLSRRFSQDYFSARFQDKLAGLFKRNKCIFTNSGTSALHLLIAELISSKKREVVLLGYSCCDISDAIILAGGEPIFINSSFSEMVSDCLIKRYLSRNTAAIIIQHTFGKLVYIDRLEEYNIPIIEDCTHSLCPVYQNSYVVASFGSTKLLTAAEGGGIFLNDKMRWQQLTNRMKTSPRLPYRESNLHLAILEGQLISLKHIVRKRNRIAQIYNDYLREIKDIQIPDLVDYSVVYRYVILFKDTNKASRYLDYMHSKKVACEKPIDPSATALQLSKIQNDYNRIISLPIYPSLSRRQIKKIINYTLNFERR